MNRHWLKAVSPPLPDGIHLLALPTESSWVPNHRHSRPPAINSISFCLAFGDEFEPVPAMFRETVAESPFDSR